MKKNLDKIIACSIIVIFLVIIFGITNLEPMQAHELETNDLSITISGSPETFVFFAELVFSPLVEDFSFGSLAQPPSTVEGTSTAGWTDDGSIVRLNTASDFVGIGTTNPAQKLTVTGGNFLLDGNITEITGSIDYVAGIVSFGGTTLNLGNGIATTTLTSVNGDLGIGTTTPANPYGTTTLAIQGDFFATGTTTTPGLVASTTQLGGVYYTWDNSDGSNQQILQTNGAGHLSWRTVVGAAIDFNLATSTTSRYDAMGTGGTVVVSGTLPANSLSTDGIVTGIVAFTSLEVPNGGNTKIILDYGGTDICTLTFTAPSNGETGFGGQAHFTLHADGATNSQRAFCSVIAAETSANLSAAANTTVFVVSNGTASIDSTSDQTIRFEVSENGANGEITINGASIILQYRTD